MTVEVPTVAMPQRQGMMGIPPPDGGCFPTAALPDSRLKQHRDMPPQSRGGSRPSHAVDVSLQKAGGRGECRMLAAPMARLQQKTQAAVTTGSAETTGIPRAMVLRLYALSPVCRAC